MHNSRDYDKVPEDILCCDSVEEVSKCSSFAAFPRFLVSRNIVGVSLAVYSR